MLRSLVTTICNHSSAGSLRTAAENKMQEIQRDHSLWKIHLDLLLIADDNVVFFLSQGLAHFVWANYRLLSPDDIAYITATVLSVLRTRRGMPHAARCKVELILASICSLSCSLDPVLLLVVESHDPSVEIGISALRTVFEEVLSDDAKLTQDHKHALVQLVLGVNQPSLLLLL